MIKLQEGSDLTVQMEPKLAIPSYIELVAYAKNGDVIVIGRMRAEFDFSEIPQDFHEFVANRLTRSGRQVWWVTSVCDPKKDYVILERRERKKTEEPAIIAWYSRLLLRMTSLFSSKKPLERQ